jgi:hypothetical protein
MAGLLWRKIGVRKRIILKSNNEFLMLVTLFKTNI